MMSLFNSFDQNITTIPMVSTLMIMTISMKNFKMSNMMKSKLMMNKYGKMSLKSMKNSWNKGKMTVMMSTMSIMSVMNLMSIMPYIFTTTSQISTVMSMSMTMWMMMLMFSMKNNTKFIVSHLIPEGSPMYMSMFLSMIELISTMIRPMTLTIRMVANIASGHLMMNLVFSMSAKTKYTLLMYLMLSNLEMMVALIQSYIMVTLLTMYYSEM